MNRLFDAFSARGRQALFFARWAATRFGGSELDEAHLLLGVLKASPDSVTRFTGPTEWTADHLQRRLRALTLAGPAVISARRVRHPVERKGSTRDV